MGLSRITIEGWTYKEAAVKAGTAALAAARSGGISVTKAEVVVHPGQSDEETVDLLAEPTQEPDQSTDRSERQLGGRQTE